LQPRLDRELQRLPDRYRAVVILCDLEGKSRSEAARLLAIAEGTLSSRLARARRLLARRLGGPGGALPTAALAVTLAQRSASATLPVPLIQSPLQAATRFAGGQAATAIVPAKVAALTEGVLQAMSIAKLKSALALVVLVGVVTLTVGALGRPALARMLQGE